MISIGRHSTERVCNISMCRARNAAKTRPLIPPHLARSLAALVSSSARAASYAIDGSSIEFAFGTEFGFEFDSGSQVEVEREQLK